jgi:hypothetical protein
MFPITMSFTVSTAAELARLVAATTGVSPCQGHAAETAKTEAKPAASEAKKETPSPKPEAPAAASAAQPAATPATQAPTAADSGATKQLDYDKDVKPAFLKLVQTKGRAAGRKIIDAFAPTKEKLSEAITTQEQFAQALKLIAKEMSDA